MSTNNTRIFYRIKLVLNSQNITNNTSNVTVSIEAWRSNAFDTYGSGTAYCTINGTSYSTSITSSKHIKLDSYTQLFSRTVNIAHGANGAKTLAMSAYISHSQFSSSSQSYSQGLDTIPRASTLSSFSMGASLQVGTANSINLGLTRASGSFTHDIYLQHGGVNIATWGGQGVPTSLAITATQVNTLLARMSTLSSATMTLIVQTKNGSTNIGSQLSRTTTVTVNANVLPTATGLSVSIYGSGRDKTIVKYVQNITRVTTSFTANSAGGAYVSSRSIVVKRQSDSGNSHTISSSSGTTGVLALSGVYSVVATVTDSRGRSATQDTTFTVDAYKPPIISVFKAVRNSTTQTTVNVSRTISWSTLGGNNTATYKLERRLGTGAWSQLSSTTVSSGTHNGNDTSTENAVMSSYEFRATITDQFGNSATATFTVSTQRVVLDIHKNEGVGIGKIHEQGVLDVDGEAFFNGDLYVNNVNISNAQPLASYLPSSGLVAADTISFWQTLPSGVYWVYDQIIPNQPSSFGFLVHNRQAGFTGADWTTLWHTQAHGPTYRKSGNGSSNSAWIEYGMPARVVSGEKWYTRFSDGTQIILGVASIDRTGDQYVYDIPANFLNNHLVGKIQAASNVYTDIDDVSTFETMFFYNGFRIRKPHNATVRGTGKIDIRYMAIGRWK